MTESNIKKQIIAIIVKFCEVNDWESEVCIPRPELNKFTNTEINSVLKNLEKNEMIKIIDDRIIRDDFSGAFFKYQLLTTNSNNAVLKIELLNKFEEYISSNRSSFILEKDETIYQATYYRRKLKINGFLIAEPRFLSENDSFAEYIIKNPNKKITVAEFNKYHCSKKNKKFERIIADLCFKGNIKKLFFPNISIKAVEFRNPVTRKDLKELGIESLKTSDFLDKK